MTQMQLILLVFGFGVSVNVVGILCLMSMVKSLTALCFQMANSVPRLMDTGTLYKAQLEQCEIKLGMANQQLHDLREAIMKVDIE